MIQVWISQTLGVLPVTETEISLSSGLPMCLNCSCCGHSFVMCWKVLLQNFPIRFLINSEQHHCVRIIILSMGGCWPSVGERLCKGTGLWPSLLSTCLYHLQWEPKSLVVGSLRAGIWPNPAGWSGVLRQWTLTWPVQEEWLGTAELWPHWRCWRVLWPFHRYRSPALWQLDAVSLTPNYTACSADSSCIRLPQGQPDVEAESRQQVGMSLPALVVFPGFSTGGTERLRWIFPGRWACLGAVNVWFLSAYGYPVFGFFHSRAAPTLQHWGTGCFFSPLLSADLPFSHPLQRALSGWLVATAPVKAE